MSTHSPDDERERTQHDPLGDELDDLPREELVAQLRIMREALPHAVYICDLRTLTLKYLNRHVGIDLGYSRAELEEMGGLPMAIIHPDDVKKLPSMFARWEHDVPTGVLESEMRIRARDGSWRWFQTRDAALERDRDGRVVKIVGTTNDITERKTAERQNLSALRLDAMGHVAGHLAHDYNNLLAVLQSQLALALENVWEPEHVRAVIEDARGTAERAAVLTRRLLGFAHQQVARSESVDLQDLLNEAAPLLGNLFHLKKITFELTPTPLISANRTQLLELLVQLVNGVSAGTTAVVIHCGQSGPPASVRRMTTSENLQQGGWALLRIEEHLPNDVERVPSPTPSAGSEAPTPQLGYGLDVARQLTANCGAHLEVAELDVRCCKLEIRFPAARANTRTPSEGTEFSLRKEDGTKARDRVLIVEDDEVLLELTRRILSRAGFDTLTASNGEAALAIWAAEMPTIDILVSDVVMPGMSGLDLASRILRDRPELPVVFVSGFLKDDLKRDTRLFQRREMAFCDKPFRPEELVATVRDLLALVREVAPVV